MPLSSPHLAQHKRVEATPEPLPLLTELPAVAALYLKPLVNYVPENAVRATFVWTYSRGKMPNEQNVDGVEGHAN